MSLIVREYGTIILVARQNIPFHIISVGIQGQIQSIVLDSTVGAHEMLNACKFSGHPHLNWLVLVCMCVCGLHRPLHI